jgi:hypothetical protein
MRSGELLSALRWWIGIGVVSFCAVGCGGSSETREVKLDPSLERLKVISRAYIEATRELEHPPQNVAELTPYLKGREDPATILQSPNDGQQFTILWGVNIYTLPPLETTSPNIFVVLAYEKQGMDGKRWVAGFRRVRQMTDEEFKEMPFPPGYKAPE